MPTFVAGLVRRLSRCSVCGLGGRPICIHLLGQKCKKCLDQNRVDFVIRGAAKHHLLQWFGLVCFFCLEKCKISWHFCFFADISLCCAAAAVTLVFFSESVNNLDAKFRPSLVQQ